MNTVRIHRKLESETLHLPELKPFLGKTVEIVIKEESETTPSEEFYSLAGRIPASESDWNDKQARLKSWQKDERFKPYWPVIGHMLTVDFTSAQRWAAAMEAIQDLEGYDFDAWRRQRECDLKHAGDHIL